MSVVTKIIFLILKSVADNKVNSELTKELIGGSIDGVSEFGINKLKDFINGEKSNIDNILSEDNMQSMNIPKENTDYVVFEIKDLLSRIDITDDVLKQCKYDNMNLSAFLWNEYCKSKDDYIDCEREIKRCLFAVAEVLNRVMYESEEFSKKILMQISNSVDNTNAELQKISEYMKVNFGKIDDNSQMVLNILLTILQQIQKMNMQDNETKNTTDERKKFKNNKKEDYIKNWNNRLFLHIDDDKNPITLADAFIMPDFKMDKSIKRIGFSDNDTLDQIIEKFVGFDRTSTLLITGVPGIGKSSLTAWIADKYKDDDRVIVLRFRDWKKSLFLKNSLLDIICDKLDCEEKDLDNKVLILDGFDEMKALNIRDRLLNEFFADINDFDNFKCIITSRSGYIIDLFQFDNVLKLKKFDIKRVEDFVKIITGDVLKKRETIEPNLEVLGIPVILYMAIMSNIDISANPTKPELYDLIFAEKGGIFDRFSCDGVGYDKGAQVLRNDENIKVYLSFLQKVAFMMFENNSLSLKMDNCNAPELEFQGDKVSVLEFPIKYLFENTEANIEFIHASINEYFVSEYIFCSIIEIIEKDNFKIEALAGVMGRLFKYRRLSYEIIEFLEYKVRNSLTDKFNIVNDTFNLMLKDGMTYYTEESYKNIIYCELRVFANMLEIMHLWDKNCFRFENKIIDFVNIYIITNNNDILNCTKVDFSNVDFREIDLTCVYLKNAILNGANLDGVNLSFADLSGMSLVGASLVETCLIRSHLLDVDLRMANLTEADLRMAHLTGADLTGANLTGAHLTGACLDEKQISYLKTHYNLQGTRVFLEETGDILSYKEYCKRKH